jgi:hypothetical protein
MTEIFRVRVCYDYDLIPEVGMLLRREQERYEWKRDSSMRPKGSPIEKNSLGVQAALVDRAHDC